MSPGALPRERIGARVFGSEVGRVGSLGDPAVTDRTAIVEVNGRISEVSRMAGTERPKRVVVVDADNPLLEINGEFFWREDHEEILARERDSAYRRGFDDGRSEALTRVPQPVMVTLPRRSWIRRLVLRVMLAWLFIATALFTYGWISQGLSPQP